ncbi:MAG: MBL fold metallo-hydrolase [Chloroflexota bacterium]
MDITWLGGSCFRLQSGALSILTDPFDVPGGTTALAADIVTLSNRAARDRLVVNGPHRLVDGPGEYEITGVPVTGIATAASSAVAAGDEAPPTAAPARNVVYTIVLDGVSVCHLGRLTQAPSGQQLQEFGSPDVLLLPIGEPAGLPVQRAVQLTSQLESRLLIPMTLGGAGDRAAVERFCRELGADPANLMARLTVTTSGLPAQPRVALLASAGAGAAGVNAASSEPP